MKRALAIVAVVLVVVAAVFGALNVVYEPTAPPGVSFMGRSLAGMTRDEAARELQDWWAEAGTAALELSSKRLEKAPDGMSLATLGITFDAEATLKHLPLDSLSESIARSAGLKPVSSLEIEPVLGLDLNALEEPRKLVESLAYDAAPAKVDYVSGKVVVTPERAGATLDESGLVAMAHYALANGFAAELPTKTGEKSVTDEQLARITGVVAEFSTSFSAANRNRSKNIDIAREAFDGVILMPGEQLSYNETVGRRSAERGYKVAGIYRNGRHDTAIGGGICQVSTTLYNAALLSGMEIVKRRNHSMPVPYVPIGRDATVDWNSIDLIIKNGSDQPIAIDAKYVPGKITFRILGTPKPERRIEITRQVLSSWTPKPKTVTDKTLEPGQELVIETGSRGYKVATQRVTYVNDKKVSTEPLDMSHYPGGARIAAVNPLPPVEPIPLTPPEYPATVPDLPEPY